MNAKKEKEWEDLILRHLYSQSSREAILLPTMFSPPILLSNIQRIGGELKKKGFTTGPDRRLGGWHMRLLAPGLAYCQATSSVPV
jgi:hypothetical protein